MRQIVTSFAVFLMLSPAAQAANSYYVSPSGRDSGDGSISSPWLTLQHAADMVGPGDTVQVRAGNYTGFDLRKSGTSTQPITFTCDRNVVINKPNAVTGQDGINVENADWVSLWGFTVVGMPRAGIRAAVCHHVQLVGNPWTRTATGGSSPPSATTSTSR